MYTFIFNIKTPPPPSRLYKHTPSPHCKQATMASPKSGLVGSNSGVVPPEGDQKFDVFYKDVSNGLCGACCG